MDQHPWSVMPDGIIVAVRLTPKGGRDEIEGVERRADGRTVLKARVRAAANEGEANAALIELLARTLGVPRSCVGVIAGRTARVKRVRVTGDTPALTEALGQFSAAMAGRRAAKGDQDRVP